MSAQLPDVIDEELLYCGLCLRGYDDEPKLLPCLHIFCKTCLQKHVDKLNKQAGSKPTLPAKPSHLAGKPNIPPPPDLPAPRRRSLPQAPPPALTSSPKPHQHAVPSSKSFSESSPRISSLENNDEDPDLYEEFPQSPRARRSLDNQLEIQIPSGADPFESRQCSQYEDLDSSGEIENDERCLSIPQEMAPSAPPVSPHAYLPMKRGSKPTPPPETPPPVPKMRVRSKPSNEMAPSTNTEMVKHNSEAAYEVPVTTPSPNQASNSNSNRNTIYVFDDESNDSNLRHSKSDWDLLGDTQGPVSRSLSMDELDADLDGLVPCYYTGPTSPVPAPRKRREMSPPVETHNPILPPRMVPVRRRRSGSKLSNSSNESCCGGGGVESPTNKSSTLNAYTDTPTRPRTRPPPPPLPSAAAKSPSGKSKPDSPHFPCPTCAQEHAIPATGIAGFPTCNFVTNLLETVRSQSTSPKMCDNCEVKDAVYKCMECIHYLCSGCKEAHHWLKITKNHRVMTLTQLQSGKYQSEILHKLHTTCCETHKKEPADYFCAKCDSAICRDCSTSPEHAGHSCASLEATSTRDRQFLGTLLETLQQQETTFQSSGQNLDEYEQQCLQEKNDVLDSITSQKESLIKVLDEVYTELSRQVSAHYDEEITRKQAVIKRNQRTATSIQQTARITDQLIKHGNHGDIVTMTANVKHSFQRFHDIRPEELDNQVQIQFEPAPICEDELLSLLGRAVRKQVHSTTPVVTMHKAFHDERSHHTTEINVMLHEFRTKTGHDDKGCKPTGIAITKEDHLVVVDDINKKVKIFHQNGSLVKELCPSGDDALIDPWDVTITKYGNFAVTDKGAGVVKILDPEGDVVSTFGSHLKQPWGIATNSLGDIIVTDPMCHAVFVHDTGGGLKYSLGTSTQERLFYCPEYVAVNHNDDIIVSDFEKHSVTIFDSIGRFLTRVGQKGMGQNEFRVPCGLACDHDGDIYVADYNNQRVCKLDMNGRFKCYFLTMVDHLMMPQALAIDSKGRLMVIDGTNVKIFGDENENIDMEVNLPEEPKPKLEERVTKLKRDNPVEKKAMSPYLVKKTAAPDPPPPNPDEMDGSVKSPLQDMIEAMTLTNNVTKDSKSWSGSEQYDVPKAIPKHNSAMPEYDVPKPSEFNYTNTRYGVFHEDEKTDSLASTSQKYETLNSSGSFDGGSTGGGGGGGDGGGACLPDNTSLTLSDDQPQCTRANSSTKISGNVTDDQLPLPISKDAKRNSTGKLRNKSEESFEREKPLRKSMNAITRKLSKKSKKKKLKELEKKEREREEAAAAAAAENASNATAEQALQEQGKEKVETVV